MDREYQICTKCIMDTTDVGIVFDKDGVCNHCFIHSRSAKHLYSQKMLEQEVKKMKEYGKGKKYDCIVGLSGGVDSSMVAYYVKKLGLRSLAIHLDNGWNSELAVKNIERIVRKLGIDFKTYVIDWEEFKNIQISFLKSSIPNIEIPTDHAIVACLYKTAMENGVKYIISGSNVNSESIMPDLWSYTARDLKLLKAINRRFGKIRFETFPTMSLPMLVYYVLVKKINYFPILNYFNYDKEKAKKFLKEEFGWQDYGYKHGESVFTKFFQNYILPKKFNIDKRRAHFSSLINSNQMKREDALIKMQSDPYQSGGELKQDKEYVIKKLGLTDEEFEKIMNLPIKNYADYPNDSLFFNRLSFIYSFIKKRVLK